MGPKMAKMGPKMEFLGPFLASKKFQKSQIIVLYVQNIAQTDSDELVKHFLILCLSFFDQKMTQNESLKKALAIAEIGQIPGGP